LTAIEQYKDFLYFVILILSVFRFTMLLMSYLTFVCSASFSISIIYVLLITVYDNSIKCLLSHCYSLQRRYCQNNKIKIKRIHILSFIQFLLKIRTRYFWKMSGSWRGQPMSTLHWICYYVTLLSRKNLILSYY